MIDRPRQVPFPSAPAWAFDLTASRGPLLVVLRGDAGEALETAVTYLVDIGAVGSLAEARELLDGVEPGIVGVVW